MIGQTILHYKILAKLGEGGMGVVYKAEDTRLKREVAIKFLPRHIAASDEEHERFKIEAQAAAALNHPNIATIHAIEDIDEEMFIVMECVEGKELKQLIIDNSQLTIDNCLAYATQIAEGLKAAHAKGIIHRDIKSSNIMLTESGQVKIMDFGLAKFVEASGRLSPLTKSGTTLGTAAYMSPEQARGEPLDQRTDIWSLGVVLYEMITGQLPFSGVYEQAILYAIVNEEPAPLSHHRAEVSKNLQRIVDKALEKDPQTRYQHVDNLLADLQQERKKLVTATESSAIKKAPSTKFMFATAAMIFAAIVIVSFYILNRQAALNIPAKHTQITFVGNAGDPAISPDGRSIVYVSGAEGNQKVMVKDLAGGEPLEILSGIWCSSPSWSPDGSELAVNALLQDSSRGTFFVPRLGGSFHHVPRIGEPLRWSPDGSRIATKDGNDGAKLIWFYNRATFDDASIRLGGTFTWLRDLDWSPSGNRLLFLTVKKDEHYQIWTIKTDGSEQQQVVEDSVELFSPRWSRHEEAIYYLRDTGQTQDLMKVQIAAATGTAEALPRILQSGLQTGASLTLSQDNKSALYTRGATSSNLWLTSLAGTEKGRIVKTKQLTTGTSVIYAPTISPDGNRVAFSIQRGQYVNIFVMPIAGGAMQQLTFLNSSNVLSDWSPDGREIVYSSDIGGKTKVWRTNAEGGAPRPFEKSELSGDTPAVVWSPGAQIMYQRTGNRNFHLLDPRTEEERPLVSNELVGWMFFPRYSPDGKSVAVYWNRWEGGRSFRGLWRISLEDSSQVRLADGKLKPIEWSADGRWIYAWNPERKPAEIMMVPAYGGKPKTYVVLPFENVGEWYITMTPDGKMIVCVVPETQSDVWLMENFDPEVGKE